jgi:hypothetical protein
VRRVVTGTPRTAARAAADGASDAVPAAASGRADTGGMAAARRVLPTNTRTAVSTNASAVAKITHRLRATARSNALDRDAAIAAARGDVNGAVHGAAVRWPA